MDGHMAGRMDNVKTVYPTTNKICEGYKNTGQLFFHKESIYEISKLTRSDFILIFSKGHNSRKGDKSDKKKNRVSATFP